MKREQPIEKRRSRLFGGELILLELGLKNAFE